MDQSYIDLVKMEMANVNRDLLRIQELYPNKEIPNFKNSYVKACWVLAEMQKLFSKVPTWRKKEFATFERNLKIAQSNLSAIKEYSEMFE